MNLKEYYKQLLSEEPKKVTPQEYAMMLNDLGLPPRSTKENLGNDIQMFRRGGDYTARSQSVVNRAHIISRDDGRELFISPKVRNTTNRAAAKAYTGVRNVLLHGTRQNPDEVGLDMDAVSSPTSIPRNPRGQQTEAEKLKHYTISNHSAFKDARHAVKHIFDADLRPEHIEGLDINHPDFIRDVIDKVASARKKNMDRYDEDRPSIPIGHILGNLDTINSKGFPSTP